MAFCPKCRFEYLPEVEKCPDCGSELVAELPELPEHFDTIKWVALRALPGVVYAQMVTEVLDQHDIPNYIQSLFGSGGLGVITGTGFGGASARIYVPESRLEAATEIQDELLPED